jgi:ABC-2 type transport system permease protein
MRKITTIIRKEWAEIFKNRLVISTIIFMPLLFTAIPLTMNYFMRGSSAQEDLTSDIPQQLLRMCPEGLTGGECFQVYMTSQFLLLFMIIPLIIPVNIAAYSVVGEKTTHSLEPLLATPIKTGELLAGKNLAAAVPAVLATWFGFALYVIGTLLIVPSAHVVGALLNPMWWLAVIVLGPALAFLSVNFSIMVSSRVNEPRVAEQVSSLVILPVLAIFFGQIAGLFIINSGLILLMALAVLVIDIILLYLATRLFQRETILTRWK